MAMKSLPSMVNDTVGSLDACYLFLRVLEKNAGPPNGIHIKIDPILFNNVCQARKIVD